MLYTVPFKNISIQLKAVESDKRPIIEVAKNVDESRSNIEVEYTIRKNPSDKGSTYGVEGPYDERTYRDPRHSPVAHRYKEGTHLSNILADFVEISWLSIHRGRSEMEMRSHREETYESTVDQKLREISRNFARYFSLLSSRAEKESKGFQEYVFLSLIGKIPQDWDIVKQADVEPEDKSTLVSVLRELDVTEGKAQQSVNDYFHRLQNVKDRWRKGETVYINEANVLLDERRMSDMVNKWRELQQKRRDIFEPRSKFQEIVNDLFSGKELLFDERNSPRIRLKSGEDIKIGDLSSGEKQMFILLGETLLQENHPAVFISDEPELSLHVKWQSSLFKHIRSLNNACQVISATHSPDIVGGFQDHVIRIEEHISDDVS